MSFYVKLSLNTTKHFKLTKLYKHLVFLNLQWRLKTLCRIFFTIACLVSTNTLWEGVMWPVPPISTCCQLDYKKPGEYGSAWKRTSVHCAFQRFPLLLRIQSTCVLLIVYLQCINPVPLKAEATKYMRVCVCGSQPAWNRCGPCGSNQF